MTRKPGHKPINSAWIFCEGTTEYNYFTQYGAEERIKGLQIKAKISENKNVIGLIDYSFNYLKHHGRDFLKGDLIFFVFDRDKNTNDDLKNAKKNKKIENNPDQQLIFSNPCFEIWILFHYELYTQPINKEKLKTKLITHMGSYNKNNVNIYNDTKKYIETAKENSKHLYNIQIKKNIILCEESNPSTMIFQLIEIIEQYKE
jgi:RloB-like protein